MSKLSFLQGFGIESIGAINKRKINSNTLKETIFTLQRMGGVFPCLPWRGHLSLKCSLDLRIRKIHLKVWIFCHASRFLLLITQSSKGTSPIQILDWKHCCEFRWEDKSIYPMAHILSRGLNGNALLFGLFLPIRGRSHHLTDWRKPEKDELKA